MPPLWHFLSTSTLHISVCLHVISSHADLVSGLVVSIDCIACVFLRDFVCGFWSGVRLHATPEHMRIREARPRLSEPHGPCINEQDTCVSWCAFLFLLKGFRVCSCTCAPAVICLDGVAGKRNLALCLSVFWQVSTIIVHWYELRSSVFSFHVFHTQGRCGVGVKTA